MHSLSIRVENLCFAYPGREVFNGFSLSIVGSSLSVVTGGNGSGKTTLFKILSTLVEPQAGSVVISGRCSVREARWVRENTSCAFVNTRGLFPNLTVAENLKVHARNFNLWEAEIDDGLKRVQSLVNDKLELYPNQLSTGMRQAVLLAKALMRPVNFFILDEPYLSLDDEHIFAVNAIIEKLRVSGATLLMSAQGSHQQFLPAAREQHELKTGLAL